jgi:bla regulator protein BlaR1
MISNSLPAIWTAMAPALGNHLWQSTVFAIIGGLLAWILRKNQARVRYGLWVAASVKFLIPFSLLAALGSHLGWSRGWGGTKDGFYFVMKQVSQPFSQQTMSVVSEAAPWTASRSLLHLLPTLLAVWLFGFLVVIFVWHARWRRISAALRQAVPLQGGREVEILRRLERSRGIRKPIEMRLSQARLEPGIFGITRPVLVWPKGISERLEDAHLKAILAHELWHVRRRDNLAAAIHMMVEALFWFHPLVWWLGARLVEERERACDEAVLESGNERQVYAESILKICEFCVGSPLACVSGVTGADLKKRIVHIMTERVMRKLDFSRKLLLSVAGIAAVAVPMGYGLLNAAQTRAETQAQNTSTTVPVFETVSIKATPINPDPARIVSTRMIAQPGEFSATNVTVREVLRMAYGVSDDRQISGAPDWLNSERYDFDAKANRSVVDELQKFSPEQLKLVSRRMLQALLAERFQVTVHHETKEAPVYALVIGEGGPKFQAAKPGDAYPNGLKRDDGQREGAGIVLLRGKGQPLTGQGVPIRVLVGTLSQRLGRIVLDKTGLTGNYDFTVQLPEQEGPGLLHKSTEVGQKGTGSTLSVDSSVRSIFTAVEEQLGLKLEPQTALMEILVIDHVEKPSEK